MRVPSIAITPTPMILARPRAATAEEEAPAVEVNHIAVRRTVGGCEAAFATARVSDLSETVIDLIDPMGWYFRTRPSRRSSTQP